MVDRLTQTVNKAGQQMAGSANGYVTAMSRARAAAKGMTGDQAAIAKEILNTTAALKKLETRQELARRKFEESRDAAIGKATADFEKNTEGMQLLPWEDEAQAAQQYAEDMQAVIDEVVEKFGVFEDTPTFRNLNAEAEMLTEKLNDLKAALAGQQQGEQGTAGEAADQAREGAQRASSAWQAFGDVVGKAAAGFIQVAGSAARAGASIARVAGGAALSYLRKLASSARNAAIQLAKLSGRAISGGFKTLGQGIKAAGKWMLGLHKNSGKANGGFKKGLMTILKYGLGIRSLYFLFRKLRQAIKEGFEELSKRNPKVKASLDSLKTALNGLKGSLATAFAPILTAVAPALTRLINMLTAAINAIGAFIAALTGQRTYQKAVGGLTATGDAAGNAAGNVEELNRQLAGFDELNVLSDKQSGGGGSGSGGSGSGISYSTEEISSGITDFVAKLKELWENADYEGIGRTIAGTINSAFERAKELISWDSLGEKITQAVNAITGIFNGLIDGIDWKLIGETFGEGVNTIIRTGNLLLTGIDWANIGKSFAEGINGLLDTVSWSEMGQLFANKFNALISTIKGLVKNFKWGEAGTAFATTVVSIVTNIDWEGLGDAFATAIDGALAFLSNAVKDFSWAQDVTRKFIGTIANIATAPAWDTLGTTMANLLNGALAALGEAVSNFSWAQEAVRKFVGAVNNLVAKVDWDVLGTTLANLINGSFDTLREAVSAFDWGQAGKKLHAAVANLVSNVDWDVIGSTLAGLLNGALDFLKNTLGDFEWGKEAVRKFVAAVNNLVAKVDWNGIGETISLLLGNAIGAMREAVSNFDWGESGAAFSKSVNAFFADEKKWEDAGTTVSNSIKGLFTWAKEFLANLDAEQIAKDVKAFMGSIDWAGIAQAIWDFLVAAFKALGNILYELIFGDWDEDVAELQQAIEDRNFDLSVPAEVRLDNSKLAILKQNLQESLNEDVWYLDIDLLPDLPPDVIQGAVQEFVDQWTEAHPTVPISAEADPDSVPGMAYEFIQEWNKLHPNCPINITLPPPTTVEADWKKKLPNLAVAAKVSLEKSGWTNLSSFVGTAVKVLISLGKKSDGDGKWSSISSFVGTAVKVIVSLGKKSDGDGKWTSISGFVGTAVKAVVSLSKQSKGDGKWSSISSFVGTSVTTKVKLKKDGWSSILKFITGHSDGHTKVKVDLEKGEMSSALKAAFKLMGVNFAVGGMITNGGAVRRFASGGIISGGMARFLSGVPHYAGGTARAHGTVFVAGESGPEVMGHINGRTEILNKSQIAQAIYSAVVSGMGAAVNALGKYLANRMGECTNAIVGTIGNLSDVSGIAYHAPLMASGAVMPYEVAAQVARTGADIQATLDANNEDLIQTIISVIGAQTTAIVTALQANRQAGTGGTLTAQQVINEINRRTQMFSASPLKGV